MSLAGFALPGECPRCCADIETPFYDPASPCDGRLVGGERCGYLALNGGSTPEAIKSAEHSDQQGQS